MQEDIMPCLVFENSELAKTILDAIQKNTLEMEPLNNDKSTLRCAYFSQISFKPFRECALTKVTKYCPYRVRLNAETDWIFISLLARNRVSLFIIQTACVNHASNAISFELITNLTRHLDCRNMRFLHLPHVSA